MMEFENRTMDERYARMFRLASSTNAVDIMALDLINGMLSQPLEVPDMLAAVKRINQARKAEVERRRG